MNNTSPKLSQFLRGVVLSALLSLAPPAKAAVDFYAPDQGHLWNRLYAGLIVRELDGVVYDDLIDPPFYPETTHLLTGQPHVTALALLREFTADPAALRAMTPLKRAVMQRDLLALVNWLARAKPGPEQQALARALVQAVRFVALSSEEIGKLPDNYAQAVAKSTAAEFDPKQPDRAFLPPDLLAEKGPWLTVQPADPKDLEAAQAHTHAFGGRSVLEVRFRHANGREAGEKYLLDLAAMPKLPETIDRDQRAAATPQFPVGSMWALVRRAILVDAQGKLVVSPLTESVQLRYYRQIVGNNLDSQAAFEWELSRRLVFGEGGFHRTKGTDQFFSHFNARGEDKMLRKNYGNPPPDWPVTCVACHLDPGILSVNSYDRKFLGFNMNRPELRSVPHAQVADGAAERAKQKGVWQLIGKLWDEK